MRRLSALVLLAVLASAASAQTAYTRFGLADRIEAITDVRAFNGALWGIYVQDLDTERVLYERNAYVPMMPASNMKLVTTAAALDVLGPGFRYQTRLYLDGPLAYGTLTGDLVVRGAGDPSFIGRARDLAGVFGAWADSLHDAGVRNVMGTIRMDDDVMDNPSTRFVRTLRSAIRERGITIHGDGVEEYPPGVRPEYERMRPVASYRSPPLAAFVGQTNTESDNAYAERILRTVAAFVYPSPGPVRPGLRARAANPMLERFGIDPRDVVVADGSGLSRDNRLTALSTVSLLRGMHRHPRPEHARRLRPLAPAGRLHRHAGPPLPLGRRARQRPRQDRLHFGRADVVGLHHQLARAHAGLLHPVQRLLHPDAHREPRPGPDRRAAGGLRRDVGRGAEQARQLSASRRPRPPVGHGGYQPDFT